MSSDGRFGKRVHDIQGVSRVLAVGDVQANAAALLALLRRAGYASEQNGAIEWTAGDAALLFVGDLVDKGIEPAKVLVAVADLHEQALSAGGRVILITGNHDDVMLKTLFGEGEQRDWARNQWFSNGGLETLARLAVYGGQTISETLHGTMYTALFSDLGEVEDEIHALCAFVREHFSREFSLLRNSMRPVALVNNTLLAFHASPNLNAKSLAEFIVDAADEMHVLWDRSWISEFKAGSPEAFVAKTVALKTNLENEDNDISIRHIVFGHTKVDQFEVPGFRGKLFRVGRLVAPEPEGRIPGVYNLLTTPGEVQKGGAMGGLEFTHEALTAIYGQKVVCEAEELAADEIIGEGDSAFRPDGERSTVYRGSGRVKSIERVDLGGQVMRVVIGAGGDSSVLHGELTPAQKELVSISPSGDRQWSHTVAPTDTDRSPDYYDWWMRVAANGDVWACVIDALIGFSPEGQRREPVRLPLEERERLWSFLVLEDGFIVAIECPVPVFTGGGVAGPGRLVRIDRGGRVSWSTSIPCDDGVKGDRRTWEPGGPAGARTPLVMCHGLLLVTYSSHSVIARSYCVDATSGQLLWKTDPAPIHRVAVDPEGRFLIESYGYGVSRTRLYERDGTIAGEWPTHGQLVTLPNSAEPLILQERRQRDPDRVCRLRATDQVDSGPALGIAADATYPVVNDVATSYFVHAGRLVAVDKEMELSIVLEGRPLPQPEKNRWLSLRGLLLNHDGDLVFTEGRRLFIVAGDFGRVAESSWPCGEGNVGGNPVFG